LIASSHNTFTFDGFFITISLLWSLLITIPLPLIAFSSPYIPLIVSDLNTFAFDYFPIAIFFAFDRFPITIPVLLIAFSSPYQCFGRVGSQYHCL
jgi:hypothetical protein